MEKNDLEIITQKLKNAEVDLGKDSIQDIWDKLIKSGEYVKIEDMFKEEK